MSRTRSDGPYAASQTTECMQTYYSWNGSSASGFSEPSSGSGRNSYSYRTMVDTVTPGYHTKMMQGQIMNNYMKSTREIGMATPLRVNATARWQTEFYPTWHPYVTVAYNGEFSPGLIGDPAGLPDKPEPAAHSTLSYAEALEECYSRMRDAPLNAWVIAGEARETIRTIKQLLNAARWVLQARSARNLFPSDKILRLQKVGPALKEVANLWLYVRYGLRPIVYDLISAIEVLHKLDTKARQRFTSKPLTEARTSESSKLITIDSWIKVNSTCSVTSTRTVQAGVLAQPMWENLSLPELLGVGNMISGMWDLVPYSFVIDWFINVSGWIGTWEPSLFIQPLTSWVKIQTVYVAERKVLPEVSWIPTMLGKSLYETSGSASGIARFTTVVTERIPNPAVTFTPSVKLRLGVTKGLDLLALAGQFIKMK